MIKRIRLMLILVFLIAAANVVYAADKKRRALDGSKIIPERADNASQQLLKSQEWIIYLVPVKDEFAKPQIDILSFSNNKFNSRNLSAKGFKEFDCAVTEASGAVSWEASQVVDSGEIASWHAELKDKLMRGVLSILKKDGVIEDLYFTTQAVKEEGALTAQQHTNPPDQKTQEGPPGWLKPAKR